MTDATDTGKAVRSRENTRERLLTAATQVFAEKGLAGATVDDLTTAAGFTRGAFYSNFSSKEEVFDQAVQQLLDRIFSTAREGVSRVDLCGDIFSDVEALISSVESDVRLLSRIELETCLAALRYPELRETYLNIRAVMREQIASIITESVHVHGRSLLIDPSALADAVIALYFNAINLAEIEGRETPTAVIVTHLINAFASDPLNLSEATARRSAR
ncbi:TetR/AcrR family transcriptional regulator [Bowdeniella massiliensis]|uniref:TetR/AcrR family transcriptional regulator n=1 Tax=Bowdeniella massiliensis TaxID=2932264 RepID=UPI002028775F|nr:TetR/AcrR family transcriptional regulator [Bowdeniella massiliensis]